MHQSIRIRIVFSGLCLFVPDNDLHHTSVLLPDTKYLADQWPDDYGGIMPHFMRARVGADYLARPLAGAPIDLPLRGVNCDLSKCEASRHVDELPGEGANATRHQIKLPKEIVSVVEKNGDVPAATVSPDCLGTPFCGKSLGARFILPRHTRFSVFNLADTTRGMIASMVEAVIESADPDTRLGVGTDVVQPVGGIIDVFVGNLTAADWLHPPEQDAIDPNPAHSHYQAYAALYPAGTEVAVPLDRDAGRNKHPSGMNPVTCITGGGCGTGLC